MAKYLRLFETVADKQAATLDYPNVNYTIENNSLEILESAPVPPAFGGLTVKYNIADPTVEVTLFKGGGDSSSSSSSSSSESGSGGGGVMPTRMIVDGNEETPINTWRFETAGEHVVQYEFADNIIPASFLFNNPIYTEVIVGDDITEIGLESFFNVNSEGILTSATIGTGIQSIGLQTFVGNENMTSITIKATTPPTVQSNSFDNANNCPIYVPAASVDAYKAAANWSTYASRIQPIS
jgi:hypothetical protein